MSKYADIIKALEEATGPSEELSARVKCALLAPDGAYVEQSKFNGAWCVYEIDHRGKPRLFEWRGVPAVIKLGDLTASLDASIALVERMLPFGSIIKIANDLSEDEERPWTATAGFMQSRPSATAAIALLIAMLRALEAQEVQP